MPQYFYVIDTSITNSETGVAVGQTTYDLLVAEREDDDHLRIIGHNVCPSKGVRKGSIFSIDALSRQISKLIKNTEESFGIDLALFRVNISDTHLTCIDGKDELFGWFVLSIIYRQRKNGCSIYGTHNG